MNDPDHPAEERIQCGVCSGQGRLYLGYGDQMDRKLSACAACKGRGSVKKLQPLPIVPESPAPTDEQLDRFAAELAYLREHWESMGLEYLDGGDRTRLFQEHDVSGSWDVEYYGGGKWRRLRDTRSDLEALAIAKKILRDRLEAKVHCVSLEWDRTGGVDEALVTMTSVNIVTPAGEVIEPGWSAGYRGDTKIEALHKANMALEKT